MHFFEEEHLAVVPGLFGNWTIRATGGEWPATHRAQVGCCASRTTGKQFAPTGRHHVRTQPGATTGHHTYRYIAKLDQTEIHRK